MVAMIIYVVLRTAFEINDCKYLRQQDLGTLNPGNTLVHVALLTFSVMAGTGLTPN